MSDRSNNLRITGPKLDIKKTASFSNSSTYTLISLNDFNLVPGTKITYHIICSNYGLTSALNVKLQDTLLTNQIYVSNSLFLNGTLLSDSQDSDAGEYSSHSINVILSNLAPSHIVQIQFSVILK